MAADYTFQRNDIPIETTLANSICKDVATGLRDVTESLSHPFLTHVHFLALGYSERQ